ncbi:hypothetical protein K0504_09965 [Neiella marina]|uniref:Uncharacterized protein n=1 Tax=Neiella holothuriorum TaxID=2870530 RepID=A0ABS7EHJ4_9GAMM|nr:hypothetical protein [Neiella holothuriorum]MBW8191363.1 hypothetical protein [Neiella holothuriorum]
MQNSTTQHHINQSQLELVRGFYAHCYAAFHDNCRADFQAWAEQLDSAQIPWPLQNSIANIAQDRRSADIYLRTHLKQLDVIVH